MFYYVIMSEIVQSSSDFLSHFSLYEMLIYKLIMLYVICRGLLLMLTSNVIVIYFKPEMAD